MKKNNDRSYKYTYVHLNISKIIYIMYISKLSKLSLNCISNDSVMMTNDGI